MSVLVQLAHGWPLTCSYVPETVPREMIHLYDRGAVRLGELTAKLTYLDALSGEKVIQEKTTTVKRGKNKDHPLLEDAELKKCLTIAEVATGIKEMARALQEEKTDEAITAISAPLKLAKKRYGSHDDPDVKRVVGIAKKYRDSLVDYSKSHKKD